MGQTNHWIYAPSKMAMYCVVAPKIKTVRDEVASTEGIATKRTLWTKQKNDIYLSLTATFHEQQR